MASFVTPGTFNSSLRELHTSVMSLLDDMITQQAPDELLNAYSEWINGVWGPFFRSYDGAAGGIEASAFDAASERLASLRETFLEFRDRFEGAGGTPDLPEPQPAPEPGGFFDFFTDAWKKALIGLGVTLGVIAVGYGVYKYYTFGGGRLRKGR